MSNHTITTLRIAVEALDHTPDAGTPAMDLPDLYELGNLLTQITRSVHKIARRAVDDLSELHGVRLRDDGDMHPYGRLEDAQEHMQQVARHLLSGQVAAEDYHSAMGHLAYRETPEERD